MRLIPGSPSQVLSVKIRCGHGQYPLLALYGISDTAYELLPEKYSGIHAHTSNWKVSNS